MENEANNNQEILQDNQFGMNDQDVQNYQIKGFFGRIKYYLEIAEPTLIKMFTTVIYWSIKFIKAFTSGIMSMIKGE